MATFQVEFNTPQGKVKVEAENSEYLLDTARRVGLDLPATCLQGWCVTCAGRLVEGVVDQSDALRWYEQDLAEGYVLLCTARARSDIRLHTHQRIALRDFRIAHGRPAPRG